MNWKRVLQLSVIILQAAIGVIALMEKRKA